MMRAKVAVITRTKNRPVMLKRAIASVCSQNFDDWIMVIVNDGGNPNEVDTLVNLYRDDLKNRVKVIHHETSLGMEAASNAGIRSVDSEYILIHDDDDTLHPDFLYKTVQFMESTDARLFEGVATKVIQVIEEIQGQIILKKTEQPWNAHLRTVTLSEMAVHNRIVPISFLYKRRVHETIGYYNEDLPVLGDWEFYLRFLRRFNIYVLQEELAYYHHRTVGEGIYSNTIIGQSDKHALYDTLIRNQLLRDDMDTNKVGLGFLVNSAKVFRGYVDDPRQQIEEAKRTVLRQLQLNRIREVVIYGTGGFAKDLHDLLSANQIKTSLFVDSNQELWGTRLLDIEVVSLREAVERGYSIFVIGSYSYMEEIAEIIHEEQDKRKESVRIIGW